MTGVPPWAGPPRPRVAIGFRFSDVTGEGVRIGAEQGGCRALAAKPPFDTKPIRDCFSDADSNRLLTRSISHPVPSTIARELAIEVRDEEIVERLHKVS